MSDKRRNLTLEFRPIDLEKHAGVCVAFARDMHDLSFGPGTPLDPDPYLQQIAEKLAADPNCCVHVWRNGVIVGQINFGVFAPDPSLGYISVFYVVPGLRGTGVAGEMERYACERLKSAGFAEARLSVARINRRAVRFYEKQGWVDIGKREDRPGINNMRKFL